jgi:hypothetical protein
VHARGFPRGPQDARGVSASHWQELLTPKASYIRDVVFV